jgi:hypothetical protein
MNDANTALVLLTAAMFFALVIERILEVGMCVFNYIEAKVDLSEFWKQRAEKIQERLYNRYEKTKNNKMEKAVYDYLAWNYISSTQPGYEGAQVISANTVRTFVVKGVNKTVGILLGIAVAFGLNINVFSLIVQWIGGPDNLRFGMFEIHLPNWLQYTVTGIIMGLGSTPMHKLITALEKARKKRQPVNAS